jgi:hypothetical protein
VKKSHMVAFFNDALRWIYPCLALLVMIGLARASSLSPTTVVKGYFRSANRHDATGMLSYCGDDFVFRDERSQFRVSKRDLRPSLEWDAVLHGKMTYEVIEEGPESAVVDVSENNDFFRLLRLDGQKLRVKFIVKDGMLKEEILESIFKTNPPYEEALQPAIEWARTHRPRDLARAYPSGKMVFNGTTAKAWASLLKEWRHSR